MPLTSKCTVRRQSRKCQTSHFILIFVKEEVFKQLIFIIALRQVKIINTYFGILLF